MPRGPKLRAEPLSSPLHVVLVEPEIPQNTGSVARTVAATASTLHLVGKLGFRIDEQAVRRAGLDYWPLVSLQTHESFAEFEASQSGTLHIFEAGPYPSYTEMTIAAGDALIFGKESVGLDPALLARSDLKKWSIPTFGPVRSLNLSNAVAIVLFEALRRLGAMDKTHIADDAIGEGQHES